VRLLKLVYKTKDRKIIITPIKCKNIN
jgi:hypothetical protein